MATTPNDRPPTPRDTTDDGEARDAARTGSDRDADDVDANPPRTTADHVTAPKFGSAGSGGAELEPGPPRP